MRIVKLSTHPPTGFATLGEVQDFFKKLKEQQPGKFEVTRGRIARSELVPGEAMLFVYKARVVFIARAKSGLLENEDEDRRQEYPYYFEVNSATVHETDEDLDEVERQYNDATGGSSSLKGQGWNHLPDSVHTESIWARLRGERTPGSRLGAEEADHVESKDDPGYVPEKDDRRSLVQRQIRQRRGQQSFRNALRNKYGDRCVVTGCELLDVIEAAHINPYRGENDNHEENGLLLRADIHTLFDLDLLTINPDRMQVELHPILMKDKEYASLDRKEIKLARGQKPSKEALNARYEQFQQRVRRAR